MQIPVGWRANIQTSVAGLDLCLLERAKSFFLSAGVSVINKDWDKQKGDLKSWTDNAQAFSMYLSNTKNAKNADGMQKYFACFL